MEAVGLTWGAIALGLAVILIANATLWMLFRWAGKEGPAARHRARAAIDELAALRAEVDHLKNELQAIKFPQSTVSPYNQALDLVQQGLPASAVASNCGISRGEAELLISLFGKTKIKGLE